MRIVKGLGIALLVLVAGFAAADYAFPHPMAEALLHAEQSRSQLHEGRVTVGGYDVAYLEGGPADGEPLVLIHGFGAEKNNFTRVARWLTPKYRVLVPDLVGFGESSKPVDGDYSIDAQVERVRAFAQAMGATGKVHLGGSSMGGFIALRYAALHPDEVATLWLLAPAGTRAAMDSELRKHYAQTGEILLVAKNAEEHARVRSFVMAHSPWLPHSVTSVLGEKAGQNYELHSRIFRELGNAQPFEDGVKQLDTRALIVWGEQDRALNPKGAEFLKAMMPNAQVVLMPDIGHLPMVEAPHRAAQDYLAFRGVTP